MTVEMAMMGSPQKAGYGTVQGTVILDPSTGGNSFRVHPEGRHTYVTLRHDANWHAARLNSALAGLSPFASSGQEAGNSQER